MLVVWYFTSRANIIKMETIQENPSDFSSDTLVLAATKCSINQKLIQHE